MAHIILTRGYVAILDDARLPEVAGFRYYAKVDRDGRAYAQRKIKRADGTWSGRFLHQDLLPVPLGSDIDHVNGAEEAAQAYDRAARELFGEFARPNFPD